MPEISIILPTYNSANSLSACLNSILCQDFQDFELLLIDDGSTDHTASLCSEYEKKDSRIQYFSLPHSGVSAARNYGIAQAKGTYIAFADSDDSLKQDYLSKLHSAAVVNKSDITICGYFTNKGDEHATVLYQGPQVNTASELLPLVFSEDSIGGFLWNKLYLASLIKQHPLNKELSVCEDLYCNVSVLLQQNCKIFILTEALYEYNQPSGSATNSLTILNSSGLFPYEPAFLLIFQLFEAPAQSQNLNAAQCKFAQILEYTMYCLLTAPSRNSKDIASLQTVMKKYIKLLLKASGKTLRQKLHYLLLAYLPNLYRAIRL